MADNNKRWAGYTALCSIALAMHHRGTEVSQEDVVKRFSGLRDIEFNWDEARKVLRAYKYHGTLLQLTFDELKDVKLPAVIQFKNGQFAMLGVNSDEVVFFLDPSRDAPVAMPSAKFREVWTGDVLTLEPKLTWAAIRRRYNLDWFYDVILHYKKYFVEVLAASFFLQAMGIMMPLFTQVIIDKVIGNGGLSTLTVLGIAMVVLILMQSVLMFVRTYLLNFTTTKLDAVLGTRLFRHLISLPVPYYEHRRVGDLMLRMNMMTGIREFLTGTTLTSMLDALFSVVFIAIMLYYSVKLTLIALIIIPLFVVQAVWFMPIYQKKMQEAFGALMAQRSFLVEAVTGMATVKALAIEPQFIRRWETSLARYVGKNFHMQNLTLVMNTGNATLNVLSTLCVLWVGGYMVMDNQFTLGQLIAFQMFAAQGIGPIIRIFTLWPNIQQTAFGLNALGDILHARMEPVLQPVKPQAAMQGTIEVRDVTFRYRLDLPPALEHISLSVKAGEKIGIVGRSGSGKSTLASLIEKIYFPDKGTITIDGRDLRETDYPWIRQQMGVVMQDNYLFDGSIRDNIAAGKPAASMAEVMRAAQLAGAHEFILELDEGYDTRVGERGAGLSGGQRQRIAIARALLTNPRILIFDEATSALDYESEREVMKNIEAIGGDRTMLIIAHRLSTVEHCDKIIVIDHGHLAETGTPAELLAKDGIYHKLYMQQNPQSEASLSEGGGPRSGGGSVEGRS
ncbi:peptidase domain-containing ABC transporter [uncultured Selenomonas sp.]|uniref:peptidase domain-containing ABC transporter n=1 Tax=uncultured Selenomonas sp. TaxID=159275 RepID=UPI0025CE3BBF|nr:peptidase domain-containing ABC transporter [uncultured Selenomonas sp.]